MQTVTRTTVSPWRTVTAPFACWARMPCWMVRGFPPISSSYVSISLCSVSPCSRSLDWCGGSFLGIRNRWPSVPLTGGRRQRRAFCSGRDVTSVRSRRAQRRKTTPAYLRRPSRAMTLAVAVDVAVVEVAQLSPPLTNEHQKATTCVIVVLVRLEVRGEVLDPFGQDRDLHFRASRCRPRVRPNCGDDFSFALFRQQPCSCFLCLSYSTPRA